MLAWMTNYGDGMSAHLRNAIVAFAAAALLTGCSTTPTTAAASASQIGPCNELDGEIALAENARRSAVEKQQAAWKAVIPVAVAVLYASGNFAAEDADRRLKQLRGELALRGCDE